MKAMLAILGTRWGIDSCPAKILTYALMNELMKNVVKGGKNRLFRVLLTYCVTGESLSGAGVGGFGRRTGVRITNG